MMLVVHLITVTIVWHYFTERILGFSAQNRTQKFNLRQFTRSELIFSGKILMYFAIRFKDSLY